MRYSFSFLLLFAAAMSVACTGPMEAMPDVPDDSGTDVFDVMLPDVVVPDVVEDGGLDVVDAVVPDVLPPDVTNPDDATDVPPVHDGCVSDLECPREGTSCNTSGQQVTCRAVAPDCIQIVPGSETSCPGSEVCQNVGVGCECDAALTAACSAGEGTYCGNPQGTPTAHDVYECEVVGRCTVPTQVSS
jgi:hypothetical protein